MPSPKQRRVVKCWAVVSDNGKLMEWVVPFTKYTSLAIFKKHTDIHHARTNEPYTVKRVSITIED